MNIHNETTTAKPNEVNCHSHPLYYDVFDVNTGEVTEQINQSRAERNAIRCESEAMRLMESTECDTNPDHILSEMNILADDARVEASIAKTALAESSERHVFQLLMELQERIRTTCSMCSKEFERSEQIYGVSCENCGKLMHICKKCKCGNWLCQSCA